VDKSFGGVKETKFSINEVVVFVDEIASVVPLRIFFGGNRTIEIKLVTVHRHPAGDFEVRLTTAFRAKVATRTGIINFRCAEATLAIRISIESQLEEIVECWHRTERTDGHSLLARVIVALNVVGDRRALNARIEGVPDGVTTTPSAIEALGSEPNLKVVGPDAPTPCREEEEEDGEEDNHASETHRFLRNARFFCSSGEFGQKTIFFESLSNDDPQKNFLFFSDNTFFSFDVCPCSERYSNVPRT
jgi:hypothetical protein